MLLKQIIKCASPQCQVSRVYAATVSSIRRASTTQSPNKNSATDNKGGDSEVDPLIFPVSGHRLSYNEYGEPSIVVRKERASIDEVKEGQILVKMLAAPVNPADINTIQGTYAIKPKQLPAVPGNEGVGVVVRSDPASGLKSGDWVIPATPGIGTWQAYVLGNNSDFIKIPSNIPLASAATISVNPCTAYRMLKDFESLNPGDCVIQNGGNSAVGQAVIQLCKEFGLKCVSLVRPREDFKALKAKLIGLGNSDTTVITDDELRSSMKGLRAQLGLNCIGGKSATEILRVLEPSRTMVTYGGMSRQPVIIPTSHLIFNDIRIKGFWMTRWNSENSIENRSKMLNEIASLMSTTKFLPPEHKFVPLVKYREALENTMKGYTGLKYIISLE
ncbi:unnamed protein product [Orchesella dallaii]|uniref:Enoyl-[acyl-carrier-protein] reductase, mitochondrial n=1 Tax=Orchesella dallaii TaxID=48710 RepID=A0ABP1QX00_9HEXA